MRYFPEPVSAWIFFSLLTVILGIASYTDQRWMKVPKWLTLPALALGLLVSLLRGAYFGSSGGTVWLLGPGLVYGALDGLLFALAGFALGFGLFFALWALGVCGGGDVKLFAALGAWVGPALVFAIFAASLLLLWLYVAVVVVARLIRGTRVKKALSTDPKPALSRIIIRYSLIATLAALPIIFWAMRVDLGIMKPRVPQAEPMAEVQRGR